MAMKQIKGLMKPLKKYAKMTLTAVFSSRRKRPVKKPSYVFTHFVIKIDITGPGWQKIVSKMLGGIHGVSHFQMEDDGTVVISGTVNPTLLLKRLAKAGTRATIKHWHYGKCSSNLYAVPNPYSYNNSNYCQGSYNYCQGNTMYYSQGQGYDSYGGNMCYGDAPYEENGCGNYGGYLGSSSHHGRGRKYVYSRY